MISRAFLILWLYSASFLAHATILEWQATGPTGANIRELLMPEGMGKNIFIASSYGVYRSRNGGYSWHLFDRGLNGFSMSALAWQASQSMLYAGSSDRGLFRRHLFDEYWTPIHKNLSDKQIVDIITDDERVFVSTENSGVFVSDDMGERWTAINQGLENPKPANFVFNQQTLYFATETGVYRFDASSQAWQAENQGLTDVSAHLLSSSVDGNLYVSTKAGLFKRTADSDRWLLLNSAQFLPAGLNALHVDRTNPNYLLAGARDGNGFISEDGGQTWRTLGKNSNSNDAIQTIIQDNNDPSVFYLGLRFSGLIPYDGTVDEPFLNPLRLNGQLTNTEITALASHQRNPRFMYAAIKGVSLFTSDDNAAIWKPVLHDFGQMDANITAILTFPNNERKVFVGNSKGELFRSDDGGQYWLGLGDLFGAGHVYSMGVYGLPRAEAVVVATATGLYQGTDNASSWQSLNEGLEDTHVTALYFNQDPALARNISIGTEQGHVYHSNDFGQTWQRADAGLADGETINVLIGSNRDLKGLYAGTDKGLYYRATPADAWQKSDLSFPVNDIKNDKLNGNLMVVATMNGVYQSMDAGITWKSLNDGLKNRHVQKIALSPHPLSIYAGTRGNGIYNLFNFSKKDFSLDFADPSSLVGIDYAQLDPEAFALFDENFLANLPPEVMSEISAEQLNNIPPEAMANFGREYFDSLPLELLTDISAENLSALPTDLINLLSSDHIEALATGALLELPPQEMGRFLSHLNPDNLSLEDVKDWLPGGWEVDPNNLNFKAPVGAKLALPEFELPTALPPQIRLPARLPNIDKGFSMGGTVDADDKVLNELNAVLASINLPQYRFRQNQDGLLQVYNQDNPKEQLAFMLDMNDIRQLGEQAKAGLNLSQNGKYQLSLASQQRLSLLPAPKDSQALLESLGGEQAASLRIGDAGDVSFSYQSDTRRASQVHRVVVFDSVVETVDEPAGVYEASGESLLVVYSDGTAQLAYAAVPYPELFIETAYTFDGVEVVTCNTDGSCDLQFSGVNYHLSPELNIGVSELGDEKIDPSINLNVDGSLAYTVQDQTQALTVTLRVSF